MQESVLHRLKIEWGRAGGGIGLMFILTLDGEGILGKPK